MGFSLFVIMGDVRWWKVIQNRLSPDFKSPKAGIYDTDFFILLHSKRKCLAISRFFDSP